MATIEKERPSQPIGYESEALSFKDLMLRLMSDLLKAIAFDKARTAGKVAVSEADMRDALNEALAIMEKSFKGSSGPNDAIERMRKELSSRTTTGS